MEHATAHICVDVEVTDLPITGEVRPEGGPTRHFTGWVGLFSALDAALQPLLPAETTAAGGAATARPDR